MILQGDIRMKKLLIGVAIVTAFFTPASALEVLQRGQGMCSDGLNYCLSLGYPSSACNANYQRAMASGVWPATPGYPPRKCFRTDGERSKFLK